MPSFAPVHFSVDNYDNINFIIAINNERIFEENFNHIFLDDNYILQRGYNNIPKAYNEAILKCNAKYICLLHQDVYLPVGWIVKAKEQIRKIRYNWGVIGVAGVAIQNNEKLYFGNIKDRGIEWGTCNGLPAEVDTLDELLLIIKNDRNLFFDEGTKNHLYGADICMQARINGNKCYAISAYCHHNSFHDRTLPPDFWESCNYMKNKYKDMLPIGTTCTVIQ